MVRFCNLALLSFIASTTTTTTTKFVTSFQTNNNNNNNHNIQHRLSEQQEREIPRRRRRSIVATTTSTSSTTPSSSSTVTRMTSSTTTNIPRRSSSLLSASMLASANADDDFVDPLLVAKAGREVLSSVTTAAVDSIVSNVISSTTGIDEPDVDAIDIARKQELVSQRQKAKTYKVTLPLTSMPSQQRRTTRTASSVSVSVSVLSLGITLCQISKGRNLDSVFELNLDTLELEDGTKRTNNNINTWTTSTTRQRIDGQFQGLVVSSVKQGSAGWVSGVRPGDILKTSSATIGNSMWPKSTLDGVKSAVLSRKAVAESIQFEFQRLDAETVVDNQYELTLARPIGLNLKETEDGYVEIVGFTPKASKLVRYAVKVGDRVLAVDSSLGDRMWPVSTVEGVISSVTARLPGQQITFRFERSSDTNIINNISTNNNNGNDGTTTAVVASTTAMASVTVQSEEAGVLLAARSNSTVLNVEDTASISTVGMNEELLQRCQGVMKRYKNDEEYVNKFEFYRVVADKVVGALASAETQVDSVTLSMILTAYLSCKQPKMAIRVFEAAVGLRADGTNGKVETTEMSTTSTDSDDPLMGKDGKQIVQNIEALDIFTISALLKAHAMDGNLLAVQTVLSALEGRGGTEMNGVEVALWPNTLQPDNHCYNIAISAAGNSNTDNGLELALQFFDGLSNPVNNNNRYENRNNGRIEKDVVSYNTILKALANYGKFEEAIETFYQMKRSGIKPDKYTYTALARSVIVVDDKDVEELLYDMKEEGVKSDVKTFNTIIRYLCEQKKLNAAKKVVSWMEALGLHPDSWTYSFLMNGLLQSGNPSGALALFETACSDKRTAGLTENVYLYTTAMTSAAAIGDHTRALELLSRMNALGIKPNIKTMTALLSACLSAEEPELAVEIFRRIPNPDSYAVTKGLLALSDAGEGNEALVMLSEKDTVAGRIQGKQLNHVYESLFHNAIKENDYMQARQVLRSLLAKGNIPSKAIFQKLLDSMGLTLSKGLSHSSVGLVSPKSLNEEDAEKFEFLLFLLDSLSGRNLPCEAPLYATILSFGHHLGGLPKKISALMVSAKAHAGVYAEKNNMKFYDERCETTSCLIGGWEDLFQSFDELRTEIDGPASLPELQVRISSRELSRVLTAEKNFSYHKRMFV